MSIFKYSLPSGAEFTLNAPTGTTQAQADFAFYSQVASGALVGYTVGQTLTSSQTRLTNFELSRLERDTAGVDRVTILSIVTDELAVAVPALANVPLQTPITAANYAATLMGVLMFYWFTTEIITYFRVEQSQIEELAHSFKLGLLLPIGLGLSFALKQVIFAINFNKEYIIITFVSTILCLGSIAFFLPTYGIHSVFICIFFSEIFIALSYLWVLFQKRVFS
jgi:hypothetical protein